MQNYEYIPQLLEQGLGKPKAQDANKFGETNNSFVLHLHFTSLHIHVPALYTLIYNFMMSA